MDGILYVAADLMKRPKDYNRLQNTFSVLGCLKQTASTFFVLRFEVCYFL